MKKTLLIAVLAALPFSMPLAWADDAHHADKDKQMQMGKMQESMLRMHEQMHKIMLSKDAKERAQLMQEHAKLMQDNMSMMQGMMGQGKMDGGMKGM